MKIKLLFILYFCLFCIQQACRKDCRGDCKGYPVNVTGIDTIIFYKTFSVKHPGDSVPYDSLIIGLRFKEERSAHLGHPMGFSLVTSAYARQPCPLPIFVGKLDSVRIFNHKNNNVTEVTSLFSYSGNKIDNSNPAFLDKLNYQSHYDMQFKLIDAPVKTDTFRFDFQLFDKRGMVFEKMTGPIVITP